MPESYPAEGPIHPLPRIIEPRLTLHAVLVRGGDAHFDDEAVYGRSAVESGIRWEGGEARPDSAESWGVVWVAVRHEPDGSRAYFGAAAARMWIDPIARKGYKDTGFHAARLDAARQGKVELEPLRPEERAAVRQTLLCQDPEAWDRARDAVREAFQTVR